MLGTLLKDRYRIDAKLGEGGMGVVYKAHDTLLNRAVAIKSLTPALVGDEGLRRLLREAQSAAQLGHPNIVAVHDVIDDGDARLIVMEYVDGKSLAELIPLEVPRAIDLAVQVCRALEYAHSRGIVHRDIKPENIMVTDAGAAKVTDFGLARSEGRSRLTQSGLIVGTVAYMAPEQVLGGTVDARSDLYALGCVIYEALTGRKPFAGDDPFTVLSQQVNVMPVAPRWHNGAIPSTLDAIIMRLLAKDPDERYASAAAAVEALEIVTVDSEAAVAAEIEAPATRTTLLERIVRGRLVGRTAEVQELREHLDRMLSAEGRLVLISGEPGIGKTRLAEELAVYAHLRGAWVLRGHCYEQDVGVPYLPFMETMRRLFHLSGPGLMTQMGERADDLARLLPEASRGRPSAPALAPEDERIRVFDAVTQWVSAASHLHPLVFALDDLHWADRASLRLLHHLARNVRGERVLILGTYREMELDLEHPLNDAISQMNRERLFYRLPLRRLSEEDTRSLLSGLFDDEVSRELAAAVYRETEGNPFFIEEVVKALVEEGKIYREGGRWQRRLKIEELEIPQSVKAVIGRRVQKAGEACRRVLTIAAVIGREFDPDVLVKVSQLEEDAVLDALDEAIRLQLIRETRVGRGTGYTFEHALIRQTLYEALNVRRRARLHQEVGEALEVLYGTRKDDHIEELAYHFGEAGPATTQQGIDYNLRAARKAASLYAMEEGERRLKVALELAEGADDPGARVSLLEALGDHYLLFAENQRATDAYRQALDILKAGGDTSSEDALRLYCQVAEAGAGWWTEASAEALRYAQAAADLLRDKPDASLKARALSLLAIHHARAGDISSARSHAEQAVEVATRLGDQHELSMAYRAMAMVHRNANEWDRFLEVVQKRRALLETAFTPSDADLYIDLMTSLTVAGKPSEAVSAGREFLEMAARLRSPTGIYNASAQLASALFFSNTWDEAQDFADRAIDMGQRFYAAGPLAADPLLYSGVMAAARGDEEQAHERVRQLEAIPYDIPPEHGGPRQFALVIGTLLEDRELVARLLPRVEQEKPRCLTCTLIFHRYVGEARLLLGDVDGAQAKLAEAQRGNPERPGQIAALAHLRSRILELRGDLDGALQHFEEAIRLTSELPDISGTLYREHAGRVYLTRRKPGDVERGRQLLTDALATYQKLGARRFEARARKLLASAGSSR
jgi:predicted Ser/Thr protein kinase